jgi:hypothetical protein
MPRYTRMGLVLIIAAGALLGIRSVLACSVSYRIWGIRKKPADALFRFVHGGKVGYIDSSGRIVMQPLLPGGDNFGGEFHEGLIGVREKGGYRFLDRTGTVVFRSDARFAYGFSEGLAPASKGDRMSKWGFIDKTGNFAISPQYFTADDFSEGLARVEVAQGRTGYIDRDGKFVISPNLSHGFSFHEGRAAVIADGPCPITNGGSCERAEFRSITLPPIPAPDCRYSFIDKSGKPISELRFDDAKDFSEGLAPVRVGKLWGYVDSAGQISISPAFESAEPFSEGRADVQQAGKAGFIDRSGSFVISPRFDYAEGFSDGRALVAESRGGGTWTSWFIDKTGNPAFSGEFEVATSFSYGLAHVALTGRQNGTFGWINTSGKLIFIDDPR